MSDPSGNEPSNYQTAIIVLAFGAILTGFGTIAMHLNNKVDKYVETAHELDKAMAVAKQERQQLQNENDMLQKQLDRFLDEQRYNRSSSK